MLLFAGLADRHLMTPAPEVIGPLSHRQLFPGSVSRMNPLLVRNTLRVIYPFPSSLRETLRFPFRVSRAASQNTGPRLER